jgi:hypothetical protein
MRVWLVTLKVDNPEREEYVNEVLRSVVQTCEGDVTCPGLRRKINR